MKMHTVTYTTFDNENNTAIIALKNFTQWLIATLT